MLNWNRIKSMLPVWLTRPKVQTMEEQKMIRLNKDFDGPKRRPMADEAKVLTPWYLPYRRRSILYLAVASALFFYSGFMGDIFRSTKRSFKLEKERKKFLKQLDEEDRIYEMRLKAARERLKENANNQNK